MSDSGFFGLYDAKVAPYVSTGPTWSAAVDLLGVRMYSVTEETVSGTHEGDDRRIAAHAKVIGLNLELEFLFDDFDVLEVLTGRTAAAYGTDSKLIVGADNMPYFGINGILSAAEGAAESLEVFAAKCKIMEGFGLSAQYGAFVVERVRVLSVWAGDTYKFGSYILRAIAAGEVEIPPAINS